jgi:alpha-tubulin suppressor-like RCC1 family protein
MQYFKYLIYCCCPLWLACHAPQKIMPAATIVVHDVVLECSPLFSAALINGQLWVWGRILPRGLVNEPIKELPIPHAFATQQRFVSLTTDDDALFALDEQGKLWAWGNASYSNKDMIAAYKKGVFPVLLFDSVAWHQVNMVHHFFAGIKKDSTLWKVGYDECNSFRGAPASQLMPIGNGMKYTQVSLGNLHGLALTTNGSLQTWGQNAWGQMGIGEQSAGRGYLFDCKRFQPLAAQEEWQYINVCSTNTIAIKKDGTLWFWGDSAYFPMAVTSLALPTQTGIGFRWKKAVTHELHSLAIREDGTLWARGDNREGQLGDGTFIKKSEWVQVGTDNDWTDIAASLRYSMAAKKDGSIWAWGNNDYYQLGDGTHNKSALPKRILFPVLPVKHEDIQKQ